MIIWKNKIRVSTGQIYFLSTTSSEIYKIAFTGSTHRLGLLAPRWQKIIYIEAYIFDI